MTKNQKDDMVQRYVWFDDIDRLERRRVELRLPSPLVDLLDELAKETDVSRNALVTGLLAYMVDARRARRVVLEVTPSVRVSESSSDRTVHQVPLEPTRPFRKRKYGI